MADERTRISFAEFSEDLTRIFERVIETHEAVLVEREDGELVEVKPVATSPRRRSHTAEDDEAFLSAAGGWSDVDIDALLKDIYTSRHSSRPPVEL